MDITWLPAQGLNIPRIQWIDPRGKFMHFAKHEIRFELK